MTKSPRRQSGPLRVRWLGRAEERVRQDLKPRFTAELEIVFPAPDVREITIHDCLAGYSAEQEKKVILGVEVRTSRQIQTHMVKLGTAEEVERDYQGWSRCTGSRFIGGRIFVRLELTKLPDHRVAVVYENAYTLFGLDQKTQYPEFLDDVAWWSIADDKPDPVSVERVISQIYGDLYRWFYTAGRPDPEKTRAFYRRHLARALTKWSSQKRPLWDDWKLKAHTPAEVAPQEALRSDAIWLLGGLDKPDFTGPPVYLDPYDYLCWAFEADETSSTSKKPASPIVKEKVPSTLIGRSHGDLHGKNILVGHQRGEVEFPVVIDYGEMSDANVLVWDFVKLEMELKTRILHRLYSDPVARDAVLAGRRRSNQPPRAVVPPSPFERDERERAERAQRLAFLFEFECLLANETAQIRSEQDAESRQPPANRRDFVGNSKVDRALAILLRMRQEAALWLGYKQNGRHSLWLEEYLFALAVYGLVTVKWSNYVPVQIESALVSSGVAAARLQTADRVLRELRQGTSDPPRRGPSYRIILARVHKKLNSGKLDDALSLIEQARADFPLAIPLSTELALILAEQRKLNAAIAVVQPLRRFCWVFGDFETLARIGRAFKNLADNAWEDLGFPGPAPPGGSVPWQYYHEAFQLYNDAFQISGGDYFPGVNAATLALLIGEDQLSRELAAKVKASCLTARLNAMGEDLYWIFVTEGEATLVSGLPDASKLACSYYDHALSLLTAEQIRMAQSSWDQICRLWCLRGAGEVDQVVATFRKYARLWLHIKPGPMGDCGLAGKR
ncbi:MAG: tetratricopeptide repeat-containing protein [Isosphaerales bacterium]